MRSKSRNASWWTTIAVISGALAASLATVGSGSAEAANARKFHNPFAYCAQVLTVDRPGPGYDGPKTPKAVRDVFDGPPGPGYFWRCYNGKLLACFEGADLPCESKADTRRRPTAALREWCRDNPNGIVPLVVVNPATIWEWTCRDGEPRIKRRVWHVGPRGFIKEIWERVPLPARVPPR